MHITLLWYFEPGISLFKFNHRMSKSSAIFTCCIINGNAMLVSCIALERETLLLFGFVLPSIFNMFISKLFTWWINLSVEKHCSVSGCQRLWLVYVSWKFQKYSLYFILSSFSLIEASTFRSNQKPLSLLIVWLFHEQKIHYLKFYM